MGPFWALFCHFWSIQQQFSCRFHFFGPIKVNFRPISNYRDTPNTFSVLTIFETPFFAIFPNFAVFCKKWNKKNIFGFFPKQKVNHNWCFVSFPRFFDISAHFQYKRSKHLGYFSRFKPKIIFFLLLLCVCFQHRLFSSSGPF